MSRQNSALDLTLPPRTRTIPAYRWLYSAVRAAIQDGRLRPGMRLPPTRELARQHRLSRGTVINAFEQLRAEGYVKGTVGSGTYVSKPLPEELLPARDDRRTVRHPPFSPRLSEYAKRAQFWS